MPISKEKTIRDYLEIERVDLICIWDLHQDEYVADYDGMAGSGDSVVEALELLCERLRERDE